jgi:hypothetical protein
MLVKNKKLGIKSKAAAGLITLIAITSFSAPARAFNVVEALAGSLGVSELYTSINGLFANVSSLGTELDAFAKNIGSIGSKGVLGMVDISVLGQEALDAFMANPESQKGELDLSGRISRVQATIAGKMGTAVLTKKGQEQTKQQLEDQNNRATAAATAASTALSADNSLEVGKQNAVALSNLAQQNKGLASMIVQGNQTAAANVTIQEANNHELSKMNNNADLAKQENKAMIKNLGNFPMPGFGVVK